MDPQIVVRGAWISATAFLLEVFCAHGLARASQEQVLPLATFSFESAGAGGSGPVSVMGTQDASGVRSLSIRAFGREFELKKAELAALKSIAQFNGIQVSYERGYDYLNGRCLYLVMWSGSLRHSWPGKLLVVKELGGVSVSEFSMPGQQAVGTGTGRAIAPARDPNGGSGQQSRHPQYPSQVDAKAEEHADGEPKR